LLVAVTSFLTAGTTHDAASDLRDVEHLLYGVSLSEFVAVVSAGDSWFDVTTDWCSAPLVGSTGRSFDFRSPCRRHDFGYRNLKLIERRYGVDAWNASSRKGVDHQFLADMRSHCRTRPWYESTTCFGWAEVFFAAVRAAGGMT
jgi:hypothetical protein